MKLLYVLGSFYPAQSGGPNNTVYWQAQELANQGVDVTVLSLRTGITEKLKKEYALEFSRELKIGKIKVYFFDYFASRYISIGFYKWVIRNLRNFDFVQLTSCYFPITWFVAVLCLWNKMRFSIAPRGELEDNALQYKRNIKLFMWKTILRRLFRKAAFILVASEQEKKFCQKYFRSNNSYEIVPNYMDLSHQKELTASEIGNKRNIIYLGRLHPKKNIEVLIDAYRGLPADLKEAHRLIIAGTGIEKYEKKLQLRAEGEKGIDFVGQIIGKAKDEMYKNSRVFVLPSHSENFGNVVVEALSCCTPVIASKYTPWSEINEFACGVWCENTIEAIRENMQRILQLGSEEYLQMARNAFKLVNEKYNILNHGERLREIFAQYAK
jgi:glycosyltransferase involved in cell wall biosynthesis